MTLQQKQSIFAQNVARLILHVEALGFNCTLGELLRTPEQAEIYAKEGKGIKDSLHCKKLALDIQLFTGDGKYLTAFKDYEPLGKYWESLDGRNRWGGRFTKLVDSCHFEMQDI